MEKLEDRGALIDLLRIFQRSPEHYIQQLFAAPGLYLVEQAIHRSASKLSEQIQLIQRLFIYTTINLPDKLGIGASHFYVEVLRVRKVATELGQGKSLFIIFDELFRGTNVKDAHEATVEVTNAFAGKKTSMFIISSHIVEAAEQLKLKSNIGFMYLPTIMNGTMPEYTYTLRQGVTDDRHGMIIIRNEGILDILKNGLKKKVKDYDTVQ